MSDSASFGDWIRRRRRALDLTREALARQVGCAVVTIRKIETDERRPSRQIAERLAECLLIPPEDRASFVHAGRAELPVDRLPHPPLLIDAPSAGPAVAASNRSRPPNAAAQEERRWATVLFARISGYTSMSERMDIEDVQDIAVRGIEQMDAQIRRFGGTVINVMGDTLLAVFGAPQAHEDDAPRAVRAAIALRDRPLLADPTHPLQLHIGINTGEVLATSHGPGDRRDYTVWGDTVNTANQLLNAASSGSVLVGEETYRATRHVVRYRAVSPAQTEGQVQPAHVWEPVTATMVPEARPLRTNTFQIRDEVTSVAFFRVLTPKGTRQEPPHGIHDTGD